MHHTQQLSRWCFVSCLAASGCLYNAGNDATAKLAQSNFHDAKIGHSLDDELALSKKMLEQETTAIRAEVAAERDSALALIMDAPWKGTKGDCDAGGGSAFGSLACRIEELTVRIAGAPNTALVTGPARLGFLMQQLEGNRQFLARQPFNTVAKCPPSGPATFDRQPSDKIKPFTDEYARLCADYQEVDKAVKATAAQSGTLAQCDTELAAANADLESSRSAADKLKKEYDVAKAAYDAALNGNRPLQQKLADIDEKLRAAKDKLDALEKAAGSNLPAQLEALQARYDAIVDAIGRVSDGKPNNESGVELVLTHALTLEKIDADQKLPPLLLEAERYRSAIAAVSARVTHREHQIQLMKMRKAALLAELNELQEARRSLDQVLGRPCNVAAGGLVAKTFKAADDQCRILMADVLLHFGNVWTVGELRARVADAASVGDLHDEAIEVSAAAMQAWENVLAVPIDLVARYHAAGVKPEELARLAVELIGFAGLSLAAGLH